MKKAAASVAIALAVTFSVLGVEVSAGSSKGNHWCC